MSEAHVHPSISRTPLPLDAENLPNVCVLCSHNCGIRIDVKDGKIAKVRADEKNPITHGYICNKGFSVGHYVNHAQRVEYPLRRREDGSFERISWDTAISEIAAKLSAIREEHGGASIALAGIGGQANHMDGAFGISWLNAVGSKRWYNAFAQEKHQHFLMDQWMFDAAPSNWFHMDQANARFMLVMGTNPRISNRGHAANDVFKQMSEAEDVTLIVLDPRETETTAHANRHVRLKPGTDSWFLLGMAATIAGTEGMADGKFLAEKVNGLSELQSHLEQIDVDEMARRCGISGDEIRQVAADFAAAPSATIMYDLAVEQQPFSTLISYLIRVISVLTGNVGKPGGNVFVETAGVSMLSEKRFEEPERAVASGIQAIAAIGGQPMFSPNLIPEEIMVDHPDRIRALWVEGANPVLSYADTNAFLEARPQLDLLVVVEPAMTETALLADYVLPTPTGYEKWEQAGFPKGFPEVFVQLRPPAVPAPGEALPEPEIYARLVEAMELIPPPPEKLFALAENALTPEGAAIFLMTLMQEAQESRPEVLFWGYRTLGPKLPSPALVAIWAICHETVLTRREGILRTLGADWNEAGPFEIAGELFRRILEHPEGVEIAKAPVEDNLEANIGWPDGKVRISPERMLLEIDRAAKAEPETDPSHPFVLALGLRTRWTANTIQRDPKWRKGRGPHCALHVSPNDAHKLELEEGDLATVATRRGKVVLPAAIDKKLMDGHVWIPNGFGMAYPDADGRLVKQGVNLNELSDAKDRDPISGCPHHKYTLCSIERAES
jgi:anaerobic selenocysteine-containing dehydrogenase